MQREREILLLFIRIITGKKEGIINKSVCVHLIHSNIHVEQVH